MTGKRPRPVFKDVLGNIEEARPNVTEIHLTHLATVNVTFDEDGPLVRILNGADIILIDGGAVRVGHLLSVLGAARDRLRMHALELQHELTERVLAKQDALDEAEMALDQKEEVIAQLLEEKRHLREALVDVEGLSRVLAREERLTTRQRREHPEWFQQ